MRLIKVCISLMMGILSSQVMVEAKTPRNKIEKAIRYTEITREGKQFNLSGTVNGEPTVMPYEAEVDMDSTIEISIVRLSDNSTVSLSKESEDLRSLVAKIAEVIDARIQAIDDFNATMSTPLDKLEE